MIKPSVMYSLYQSWGMQVQPDANVPPDLLLDVGETRFAAHSTLLAAHSGYIRAALYARQSIEAINPSITTPLVISNISPEQFAPLLAYMYSGHLELTIDNVFIILLATHILQMPRALELCREFLAVHQLVPKIPNFGSNNQDQGVIKPIPNRHTSVCAMTSAIPPINQGIFNISRTTHFRPPDRVKNKEVTPLPEKSHSTGECTIDPLNGPQTTQKLNTCRGKSTSTSILKPNSQSNQQVNSQKEAITGKIVIDIASCDGPVRFSRVLNHAYNSGAANEAGAPEINTSAIRETYHDIADASFNTQMAKNIRECNPGNDNPETANSSDSEEINIEDVNPSENSINLHDNNFANGQSIYMCMHCNHTFKSQYCYQKHARRHLHPVESNHLIEGKIGQGAPDSTKLKITHLDMNVQYYPCKTCGSKFPSYYFVHKHRKSCHAEENN